MAGTDATARMHLEATLPGAYYCDADVLEAEWERIFQRSWICAGREERAADPGQYFTLAVGQESVLVVRDREGRLRAFYNVCRHRGARLCPAEEGRLKGAVSCSYHAWTYSLDGRLIGTPHLTEGEAFPRDEFSLVPVALETWGGFIFINLEGERAAPLAQHLGAIPERLKRYPLATLKSAARQTLLALTTSSESSRVAWTWAMSCSSWKMRAARAAASAASAAAPDRVSTAAICAWYLVRSAAILAFSVR